MHAKEINQDQLDNTIDEIQAIMDRMDRSTFHAETGLEWEGSIQNAPTRHIDTSEQNR